MARPTAYELYYWTGIQGRGEFVRLALEEADAPYVDVARLPVREGGGDQAIVRLLEAKRPGTPPFAAPVLKWRELVIAQTANILAWLGPRLHLSPSHERGRVAAHQLQLTIADLVTEAHDVHHPLSVNLYYEEQKREALLRGRSFRRERLPKFLRYFERVLEQQRHTRGRFAVGAALSYVDLSLFQLLAGLEYAFPRAMARERARIPRLIDLGDRVAARPRIAAYLASPRRLPFNEQDVFRHYPELDR